MLLFHTEMISAEFFWENVLLRGKLQIDANNLNFFGGEVGHINLNLNFRQNYKFTRNFSSTDLKKNQNFLISYVQIYFN